MSDDYPGRTPFLVEHKRRPTAKRDGIQAWLQDEIDWLESITRTPYGDGSLSAFKRALAEIQSAEVEE